MPSNEHLFHILPASDWATTGDLYEPASLAREGFIHLSTASQWPATLERWFAGQRDLLLLEIDTASLTAPLRYEEAHGEAFPHLYGPLERAAVVKVHLLNRP
ncbi:MAG: DUF952 domain-containing protein [Myxococcales bacterium]|nr:DUF952 domain-containing protein [Myxococcales bacterium]